MPAFSQVGFGFVRVAAAVVALVALIWSFAAPPAVAGPLDPITITATDPTGDAYYDGAKSEPGLDLTGFSIVQDRAAKVVRGTVTFAGTVSTVAQYELRIALGLVEGQGSCNIDRGYGWAHIRHDMGTDVADYIVSTNVDVRQDVGVTRKDGAVDFLTPPGPGIFDGRGFYCIVVQTERILPDGVPDFYEPADRVTGFTDMPADAPAAVIDPGKGIPAPILDADSDGVHDGVDKCPQQPGAATTGCELVPLAQSIKLGTKRVVINRLLATTAGTCPTTVKVVVTLKGKSLARRNVGTLQKGKFCHVLAVVDLKKKVSKARVVVAGAGVTSVAATVKK